MQEKLQDILTVAIGLMHSDDATCKVGYTMANAINAAVQFERSRGKITEQDEAEFMDELRYSWRILNAFQDFPPDMVNNPDALLEKLLDGDLTS